MLVRQGWLLAIRLVGTAQPPQNRFHQYTHKNPFLRHTTKYA